VPLPFLFLSPASSLYGSLFHLILGLFVPQFGSSGFRRFTALRLRQFFYAPPPRHSLIATFLSGVPARSRLSLLRLIILLFILCFLWFTYILFPLFIFVLLGFLVFALVFPCIAFFCLFCVFFYFYSSTDLLYVCFAVLHPLSGLFPRPHRVELLTRPSVYGFKDSSLWRSNFIPLVHDSFIIIGSYTFGSRFNYKRWVVCYQI
jgi:hypothetical protein